MLLLADVLKNPHRPECPHAAVWIRQDRIAYAGPREQLPAAALREAEIVNLGAAVLSPGLVNAHAHLALTALAGLSYPGSFVAWIEAVLAAQNGLTPNAQTLSLRSGIAQTLSGGATTVGDHFGVESDLDLLLRSPLRGKVFLEVLGVVPEIAQTVYEHALALQQGARRPSRLEVVVSPHSAHAVEASILRALLQKMPRLLSIHLAESETEQRFFSEKSGALYDFVCTRTKPAELAATRPLQALPGLSAATSLLLVHGNYLNPDEILQLAQRGDSIVHCPLSHRYFGHRPFPMQDCLNAGVNLALGSDSLASASSLSMFEVMRATQASFPALDPEQIFSMASTGGAKALHLDREIGEITVGKKADLIAVPKLKGLSALESIFRASQTLLTLIDGQPAFVEAA